MVRNEMVDKKPHTHKSLKTTVAGALRVVLDLVGVFHSSQPVFSTFFEHWALDLQIQDFIAM